MKQTIITLGREGVLPPEIQSADAKKNGTGELGCTTRDDPRRIAAIDQERFELIISK